MSLAFSFAVKPVRLTRARFWLGLRGFEGTPARGMRCLCADNGDVARCHPRGTQTRRQRGRSPLSPERAPARGLRCLREAFARIAFAEWLLVRNCRGPLDSGPRLKEGRMRCLGTATAQSSYTLEEGSLRCADAIIENRFELRMSWIRSICVVAVCKRCTAFPSCYKTAKRRDGQSPSVRAG